MVTIRQCNETDLPSCGVLLQQAYAEPPNGEHWTESRATAYLESFFRIDSNGVLIAIDDAGKIVGAFLALVIHGTPVLFFSSNSYSLPASIVVKELPAT